MDTVFFARPEAKTGFVLCRISGIARADGNSVDASLTGSTGERSVLLAFFSPPPLPPDIVQKKP